MKKKITLSVFILLLGSIQFLSFSSGENLENPVEAVKAQYHRDLDQFKEAVNTLYMTASQLHEEEAPAYMLRDAHLVARKRFKQIEYLLEYLDPSAVKRFINGAPLHKLEPHIAEITVIQPKGLQTLDELIFSEDPYSEKAHILKLCKELKRETEKIHTYQKNARITHRFIFEAAREELVRIFTLGVTGFDTPGSVNALPEATVSLTSLSRALAAYYPMLEKKDNTISKDLDKLFSKAISYLERNNDFDSFDRLSFLKTCVNPLYDLIYQAQRRLGIELIYETTDLPQPINHHAGNLFDEDYLNPYYFARLGQADVTPERVELGRLLFFDPILSGNNERSCASCHNPELGFTDGMDKSMAINMEGKISRNAPTLINSVYAERYFLDLRLEQLEQQMLHVVFNEKEFNTDFHEITEKLKKSAEYRDLFNEAYAEQKQYAFTPWSISNALTCYLISLKGFNSPFDQYVRGESDELDQAAQRGFNLFMGKAACGTCHFAPTFSGLVPPRFQESESEVLGVPLENDPDKLTLDPDKGRFSSGNYKEQSEIFLHSFKTTTVRNAALTAPYMHNGVYQTLEEVVDFYNKGGGAGMGLDVPNQTLPDAPLNLTEREQKDLIAFMETLTDTTGITATPSRLPQFEDKPEWNKRKIGGNY
jgi:cytochrome c peroxidase